MFGLVLFFLVFSSKFTLKPPQTENDKSKYFAIHVTVRFCVLKCMGWQRGKNESELLEQFRRNCLGHGFAFT